jgi:hypothetical protein
VYVAVRIATRMIIEVMLPAIHLDDQSVLQEHEIEDEVFTEISVEK